MKRLLVLIVSIVFANNVFAQFHDSFNRTYFYPWQGDTAKFLLTGSQLQSNSSVANDNFYLSHPTSIAIKEWRLQMELKFNTSSTNYTDFYLYANNAKLDIADTALYLRIGNTKDEISVYQKIQGLTLLLFDGTDGVTNNSSNFLNFRIELVKDTLDIKIGTDAINPSIFEHYKMAIDTNWIKRATAHTGWVIKQSTASFFGKHFFDNFYAGEVIRDTVAPKITGFKVWNENDVAIYFSENIDSAILKKTVNYLLNPQNTNPVTVFSNSKDSILLHFTKGFSSGSNHSITIDSLRDSSGNIRLNQSISFFYKKIIQPTFKDLLITEIYSKPIAGYLGVEAIEVYNNNDFYVDLKNCKLSDLTSSYTLPNLILEPKKYYVFCDKKDTIKFLGSNVVALSSFPTLNDDGDLVRITNAFGNEVYSVNFQKNWHEIGKQDGGWSLELVDIKESCPYNSHYKSSIAISGHTLGFENSKFSNIVKTQLQVNGHYANSSKTLQITWNKPINFEVLQDKKFFSTYPFLQIDSILINPVFSNQCVLYFKTALQDEVYQLNIASFKTCDGQNVDAINLEFGSPKIPSFGSLMLSEVMFNSKTLCSEYIEIDNANQFLELKSLFLVTENEGKITTQNVSAEGDMLLPYQKLVLVKDLEALAKCHSLCETTKYIQLKTWTSLNDNEGKIWLTNFKGLMIDSLVFSKTMHSKFISDDDGVSIEKVDTSQVSWRVQAWASSPSTANFATPGCANHLVGLNKDEKVFSLSSPYFSQNEIGKEQGVIQYQMPLANYSISIVITDRFGRMIIQLANNEIIPATGNFLWNGSNTEGQFVAQGIYFVQITAVHENGDKKTAILELTKL